MADWILTGIAYITHIDLYITAKGERERKKETLHKWSHVTQRFFKLPNFWYFANIVSRKTWKKLCFFKCKLCFVCKSSLLLQNQKVYGKKTVGATWKSVSFISTKEMILAHIELSYVITNLRKLTENHPSCFRS